MVADAGEPLTAPAHAEPLVEPTVTIDGLELDQVPPAGEPTNVSHAPGQSGTVEKGTGTGVTETTVVTKQPVAVAVYVIV